MLKETLWTKKPFVFDTLNNTRFFFTQMKIADLQIKNWDMDIRLRSNWII